MGYSFGYGSQVKGSREAADDFITFVQGSSSLIEVLVISFDFVLVILGWTQLFPEFQSRETIIAGESYGGIGLRNIMIYCYHCMTRVL